MTTRLTPFALLLAAAVGCGQPAPRPEAQQPPSPTAAAGDASKLEPLVMAEKPAGAITVNEALTKKAGEKVVVTGQVPTEKVKPYNAAFATFVMLSHADMAKDDIKEEFDCDNAAKCPTCKAILDEHAVRVELVDAKGAPVAATLEGFRGLKPGSTITVEGEVRREGKDNKLVRVVATRFYPG
ncbi:hypothetical protein [Urbifossiella limnaea]|uniref:Uncharacterized protein n=1 Tax=Urbifossiella limnaea TaxID=2528023 RepID=A0A517XV20_9BACT|nr:hypothetical protein [Urbifossiella limnaea]QDU21361.1 hypothetical protein ETAA1_33280 [Urbifossiella limnaea]